MITTLIEAPDATEIVRDQIAAILLTEATEQQAIAVLEGEAPELWRLRVFRERVNPWAEFQHSPDQADAIPIVNVSLDGVTFDGGASNTVESQTGHATYHIHVYGYGVAEDEPGDGHTPGDLRAALECQRAVRLVRQIIMAAEYTYLGLRGTVGQRWITSIQYHSPAAKETAQQIVIAQISLRVRVCERSPQIVGEPLDLISAGVHRHETGELYFTADYESAP